MTDYFNESMNIISDLNDKPNLSASAMKAKFDEAGQKIKTFINGTLATDIANLKSGTAIVDGAVKTNKIYDGAVTTGKIADGAVNADKLAALASIKVTNAMYGDTLPGSGTTGQIFFKKVT